MFTLATGKPQNFETGTGNSKSGALRETDSYQSDIQILSSTGAYALSDHRSYPRTRGHSFSYADHVHDASLNFSSAPQHRADSLPSGNSHGDTSLPGAFPHSQYGAVYQPVNMGRNVYAALQDIPLPSFAPFRRNETPIQTSVLIPSYPPKPASSTTTSSNHDDSEVSPPTLKESLPPKPRKSRREKPYIELAPDQPPTTQGKPRARVYVACVQCRNRKIRCDGAKPVCHNCSRRTSSAAECSYDAIPKRRGPDKTPGARQRMARDLRNEIENDLPLRRRRRRRENSPVPGTPNGADRWAELSSGSVTNRAAASSSSDPVENHLGAYNPINRDCRGSSYPNEPGNTTRPLPRISIPYNHEDNFDTLLSAVSSTSSFSRSYSNVEADYDTTPSPKIGAEPSIDFTRKIWWDSLISLYHSLYSSSSQHFVTPTPSQRQTIVQAITSDLRFLFRVSNYWFQFFHVPKFFSNYFNPARREQLQPSLILAVLALSTFWQSSETGNGKRGREKALRFRQEAQGAMEASFNAGWVDETLAQAAWLLALFEVCAHPFHSTQRSTSSLLMLDSIIQSLALTAVDADDPHASMFTPRTVPVVTPENNISKSSYPPSHSARGDAVPSFPVNFSNPPSSSHDPSRHTTPSCACISLTLGLNSLSSKELTPMWEATPAWDDSWSDAEIRKESCRRLCWSAMQLAAGHVNYASVTGTSKSTLNLFVSEPANYSILFSGESISRSPLLTSSQSSKDTVWALYDRAFLLWHGCMRMRHDPTGTDAEKAHFGVNAWLEADALERALNKHACGIERAFLFQGREYLFNTRMCISYEYQRFIPLVSTNVSGLFHRKKAEEWLSHQAMVAARFVNGLHTITGNANSVLGRRPFFVFWFMGQISRALKLWECDNTLTVALHVCKAFLAPIDCLTALWPCPEQRIRYESLRERLNTACFVAGLPPIPPSRTLLD